MTSKHEKFESKVTIFRLTDGDPMHITGYSAEVQVKCTQCDLPFRFVGCQAGWAFADPRVSVDALQLRIPIEPAYVTEILGNYVLDSLSRPWHRLRRQATASLPSQHGRHFNLNLGLFGNRCGWSQASIHNGGKAQSSPKAFDFEKLFIIGFYYEQLKRSYVTRLHANCKRGLASVNVTKYLRINCRQQVAHSLLHAVIGSLLFLKLVNFRAGFGKLLPYTAYFSIMATLCLFFNLLSFNGGYANAFFYQPIFAVPIEVSQEFKGDDDKKQNDTTQLEKVMENCSGLDRIPTGQGHDDFLPILLAIGTSFLFGFKLSNFLSRRHLDRMRELWRK